MDKKALYENIMRNVSKSLRQNLNESQYIDNANLDDKLLDLYFKQIIKFDRLNDIIEEFAGTYYNEETNMNPEEFAMYLSHKLKTYIIDNFK